MQFSTRSALAALLMATDALACGKGYHHRPKPTTLQTSTLIATPVPSSTAVAEAPAVPTILPTVIESSSSASSSSSSVIIEPSTTSSSSSAASTPTSTSGLTADEQAALDSQNSARADVGATALTWDAGLASDALEWAQHLAASGSAGTLTHSTTTTDGENLYWQSNSGSPYTNAANAWVGEKDLYNGEAITGSGNFEEYGHYSMSLTHSIFCLKAAVY